MDALYFNLAEREEKMLRKLKPVMALLIMALIGEGIYYCYKIAHHQESWSALIRPVLWITVLSLQCFNDAYTARYIKVEEQGIAFQRYFFAGIKAGWPALRYVDIGYTQTLLSFKNGKTKLINYDGLTTVQVKELRTALQNFATVNTVPHNG